jgi:hypothetical protein
MGKGIGILTLFVVGSVVMGLGAWKYDTSQTDGQVVATETAIKSAMEAELPNGSSQVDVRKFLDAHGVMQGPYINFHAPQDIWDGASGVEGAMSGPFGNSIHGCRLDWVFFFDSSEQLLKYTDNALCKSSLTTSVRDPGQPMRPGVDAAPKAPTWK